MSKSPVFKIVSVSPSLAAKWLEKNESNRNPSENHIRFLADEMTNGRWGVTPDAIAFNTKGVLINGQHRMFAVARSGVTSQFAVMEGVEDHMKEFLDLGRARSIPDMLKMIYGVDRARLITGALRIMDDFVDDRRIKLSVGHALEQIARYKPAFDWLVADLPGSNQFVISPIVAALALAHRSSPTGVEEFARRLLTGTDLAPESPALKFREYVHGRRGLFRTREDKRECFVLCLVAVNKHIKGGRIKLLRRQDELVAAFAVANGPISTKAAVA